MKKRSSDKEYLPDHANMAKEIFGFTDDRMMTVPEIASKVLNLPGTVKTKPKQPSKKLQQVVHKIGSTFMTLEDSINEALELGRQEGFTDLEIGDLIRAEFKRINRPRMTLARYLPVTAKHMEKARPKSDFGNKMLPNKPVVANRTLPNTGTTTAQHQDENRPGKFNQAPDDYDIERLEDYDAEYLREIVRWNHEGREDLIKAGFKWQARFDEMKTKLANTTKIEKENAEFHKKLDGVWKVKPEEYKLEHLKEYGNKLLIEIIRMLDVQNETFRNALLKGDSQIDKLNDEIRILKKENEALKTAANKSIT